MNKIYKTIRRGLIGKTVVVSELAKGRSKNTPSILIQYPCSKASLQEGFRYSVLGKGFKKKKLIKQPLLQIISIATLLGSISFTAHAQHSPVFASGGTTINLPGGDSTPYISNGALAHAIAATGVGSTVNVTGSGGIIAKSTSLTQTGVIYAEKGGRVDLGTGSFIQGEGSNGIAGWTGAVGIAASNVGSYITARDVTIDITSDNPYGVYANTNSTIELFGHTEISILNDVNSTKSSYGLNSFEGGTLNTQSVNLTIDGKNNLYSTYAYGVYSSTNNTATLANSISIDGDFTFDITGQSVRAVYANAVNNSGIASRATLKSLSGVLTATGASGDAYVLYVNNSGIIDVTDTVNLTATANSWNVGALAQNAGKITLSGTGVSNWNLTSNNSSAAGIYASGGAGTSVVMEGQSIWKVTALGGSGTVYGVHTGAGTSVTLDGHSQWTLAHTNNTAAGLSSVGGTINQTGSMVFDIRANDVRGIIALGAGSTIQAENIDLTATGTTAATAIYSSNGTIASPNVISLSDSVLTSNKQGIVVEDGYLNLDLTRTTMTNNGGNAFNVSATAAGNTALVLNADASEFTGSAITDTLGQFDLTLNNNSHWTITDTSNLTTLVNDHSTVTFSMPSSGAYKTLSVSGNYTGNAGNILFNTQLEGDSSPTDLLHVGGNATGLTYISVNNVGGQGGTTTNGIMLVQVDGISNANAFALASPVSAGIYEYTLHQGQGANAQNWYLMNTSTTGTPTYNSNIGAYFGNQYVAGTMFNHNILDRRNSVRNTDRTVWMRTNYGDSQVRLLNGTQDVDFSTTLIQAGVDVYQRNDITAGLYVGYGNSRIHNQSRQTSTKADGTVDGYQVGAYASWVPEENKGPYLDLWAYHGWYRNKLSGESQLSATKYNSTGYALSAEAGYGVELSRTNNRNWILEPHAQLIYSRVSTNHFYDSHTTRYGSTKMDGWQSRLGARLYGNDTDHTNGVTPFVELNWLHSTLDGKANLSYTPVDSSIARNVGEVKLGVQGQRTERLSLWGHMGLQSGSQRYRRHEIQLGIGYQW